jgi:hypothetical protein
MSSPRLLPPDRTLHVFLRIHFLGLLSLLAVGGFSGRDAQAGTSDDRQELKVEIVDPIISEQGDLSLKFIGKESFVIESPLVDPPLRAKEIQLDLDGSAIVQLGPIQSSGWYVFPLRGEEKRVLYVLVQRIGKPLQAIAATVSSPLKPEASFQSPVGKFYESFTLDLFTEALKVTSETWFLENSLGLASTATFCVVPGAQSICIVGASEHAISFAVAVLETSIKLMEAKGLLSSSEASILLQEVFKIHLTTKLVMAWRNPSAFDQAITLGEASVDIMLDDGGAKIATSVALTETSRMKTLFMLVKNAK